MLVVRESKGNPTDWLRRRAHDSEREEIEITKPS